MNATKNVLNILKSEEDMEFAIAKVESLWEDRKGKMHAKLNWCYTAKMLENDWNIETEMGDHEICLSDVSDNNPIDALITEPRCTGTVTLLH